MQRWEHTFYVCVHFIVINCRLSCFVSGLKPWKCIGYVHLLPRNVLDLLKVESHQSHSESLGPRWELIQCVRSQRWYEEFMVSVHRDWCTPLLFYPRISSLGGSHRSRHEGNWLTGVIRVEELLRLDHRIRHQLLSWCPCQDHKAPVMELVWVQLWYT